MTVLRSNDSYSMWGLPVDSAVRGFSSNFNSSVTHLQSTAPTSFARLRNPVQFPLLSWLPSCLLSLPNTDPEDVCILILSGTPIGLMKLAFTSILCEEFGCICPQVMFRKISVCLFECIVEVIARLFTAQNVPDLSALPFLFFPSKPLA